MSPIAPRDRKLARLIRDRVAMAGFRDAERVLFLDVKGEILKEISPLVPSNQNEVRATSKDLLDDGRLAVTVHLFPAWELEFEFGVVEIFDGPDSTLHGILHYGQTQWIRIPPEISDSWGRTWNLERKE